MFPEGKYARVTLEILDGDDVEATYTFHKLALSDSEDIQMAVDTDWGDLSKRKNSRLPPKPLHFLRLHFNKVLMMPVGEDGACYTVKKVGE